MSLSERLAAAAKARELGHGRPAAPEVAKPDDAVAASAPIAAPAAPAQAPVVTVTRPGQRIIAPASTPVDVVVPDPDAAAASTCPTCGRTGELGMVDLPARTADWSCLSCGTLWQVTLTE